MSSRPHPASAELIRQRAHLVVEIPEVMVSYGQLSYAAHNGLTLNARTTALIALGIAVAHGNERTIADQVCEALDAGASQAEILDTVGISVMMAGAPATHAGDLVVQILDSRQGHATLESHLG